MAKRHPLLLMPTPTSPGERGKRNGGPPALSKPTRSRQEERLGPKFTALSDAMSKKRLEMRVSPGGADAEEVIVLETAGPLEEFVNAATKITGIEWLTEIDEPDLPPDPDFFVPNSNKPLNGKAYLIFVNQQALQQLLSLWQKWTRSQSLGYGFGVYEQLFSLLKDVRTWSSRDRLESTGVLEDWRARVAAGSETVRCEIELWYRRDPRRRVAAAARLRRLLEQLGAKRLQHVTVEEIEYDALLGEIPLGEIKKILASPETAFVQCEDIRLFCAVGQMAGIPILGEPEEDKWGDEEGRELREPVAALLDGLPLQNHKRLAGRLEIDDPDGWESDYQAVSRVHGTGMASLILHGDLGKANHALSRRLYVRPIMRPRQFLTGAVESVPDDVLPLDLVHRAVRRMFERSGEDEPAAPEVCIINFSIGDRYRPFDGAMSPLSRLLDYLAFRYGVLFVVSAGNYSDDIILDHAGPLGAIPPEELEKLTLRAIAADVRLRKLLSPAEGVNVLSVGAAHADESGPIKAPGWVDPYTKTGMPSIFSGQGMGYRRCVKPDVLMPGGRTLIQAGLGTQPVGSVPVRTFMHAARPGQQCASPGKTPGDTSAVKHIRGTSGATALATRSAIELYDVISDLRKGIGGEVIDQVPMATWIRTVLAHAARWPQFDAMSVALKTPDNSQRFREYISRMIGYGLIDTNLLGSSSDYRVTALGGGALGAEQAHVHRFPLPPSLAGKAGWRRLVITLSYFSPVNPAHQGWRRAHLWFEPPTKPPASKLSVSRTEVDWQAVTRGTLQHEILEGNKADIFLDGDGLEIKVSCRATAGALEETVPYALAVTLEVAESIGISIYDEIAQRIRPAVRIQPKV